MSAAGAGAGAGAPSGSNGDAGAGGAAGGGAAGAGGAAGSGGAGGGAPAGGPAAGAPAAGGNPKAPAAGSQRSNQPGRGGGRRNGRGRNRQQEPFDQNPAFLKRVRQEGVRQTRRLLEELGVDSVEALKAKVGGGAPAAGAGGGGQPPVGGGAPAGGAAGGSARERQLEEENNELKRRTRKQHQQLDRQKRGRSADAVQWEMKYEARVAGIAEKYHPLAMNEYADLWTAFRADPATVDPRIKAAFEKDPVDGRAVFSFIREQMPAIAAEGAGAPVVVPLAPTTSPPASRAAGEGTPPPKPPGQGGAGNKPFDAMDLDDDQWRDYKRKHGMRF